MSVNSSGVDKPWGGVSCLTCTLGAQGRTHREGMNKHPTGSQPALPANSTPWCPNCAGPPPNWMPTKPGMKVCLPWPVTQPHLCFWNSIELEEYLLLDVWTSLHPGSPEVPSTPLGRVGPSLPTPVAHLRLPRGLSPAPSPVPGSGPHGLLSWLCPRAGWAGTSCWRIPGSSREAPRWAWELKRKGSQGLQASCHPGQVHQTCCLPAQMEPGALQLGWPGACGPRRERDGDPG